MKSVILRLPSALKFYSLMNPAKMTLVTYSELELEKTALLVKTNVEAYLHYNLQR